jgi:hypothetical protein
MDKKADFPNWNADKFKVYESKNRDMIVFEEKFRS